MLPPVALLALHFVLVHLPVKLRSVMNTAAVVRGTIEPTEAAVDRTRRHPTALSGDNNSSNSSSRNLSNNQEDILKAWIPGSGEQDQLSGGPPGGVRAGPGSSASSNGGRDATGERHRLDGGGSGDGHRPGTAAATPFQRPSHVFDVVLPADPVFESKVQIIDFRKGGRGEGGVAAE